MKRITLAAALAFAVSAPAAILEAGPGMEFETPSAAARVAKDGDTVAIAAGEYLGDVCVWNAGNLTIRGAGIGRTVIDADGKSCMGKGIWIVRGANTVIEGISFRGAKCADRNGAGIRLEADAGFTARSCSFSDCENGILAGALPNATVTVEKCVFRGNGAGDGYSHNIYIGEVAKFVFADSVSDHALGGHCLKSRARETIVRDSVFDDGEDGESSYLVNFPNGGKISLEGCRLVQSPKAPNGTMVSIGEEGAYPGSVFEKENCVFVNLRRQGGCEVACGETRR